MKILSIKSIVDFKRKPDRSRRNFVNILKLDKAKINTEGGGDYWITSLSAIRNSFKLDDLQSIIDKRIELAERHRDTGQKRIKAMHKRNMEILNNYIDYDLRKWRPSKEIKLLKQHKGDSVLTIKGLQIIATPQYVFSFQKNDDEEVGAIWFIAKLNGFRKDELGMFTDILYRYLKTHFSKDYILNSRYCIAVDVFNKQDINYSQLEKEEVPSILNSTVDDIKKFM